MSSWRARVIRTRYLRLRGAPPTHAKQNINYFAHFWRRFNSFLPRARPSEKANFNVLPRRLENAKINTRRTRDLDRVFRICVVSTGF